MEEEYEKVGWKPTQIAKTLNQFKYKCHPSTVLRHLRNFTGTQKSVAKKPKISRTIVDERVLEIIQSEMVKNDETTMRYIQNVLEKNCYILRLVSWSLITYMKHTTVCNIGNANILQKFHCDYCW